MPALVWLLSACSATIQVYGAPEGASVYLTKTPPAPNVEPAIAVAQGELPTATFNVNYYVWDDFYVWVGKDGYKSRVIKIPKEAKVLPIVGTFFCLFPVLWAAGPLEGPVNVELDRN